MPDVLTQPFTWILVALALVASLVIGRARHEPWLIVGVRVLGGAVFVIGLLWANDISAAAGFAAVLAVLGMALLETAWRWHPRAEPGADRRGLAGG